MRASVNGTELFYVTHGRGRPVLMMHGGLGLDHTTLRPWHDQLGDGAELIYYDHRGNGRSERPATLDDVDHAVWAADAEALRAHLGHERIVLLGHSYGAFLALEYALRYPSRLDGLILVSAAPVLDYADAIVAAAKAHGTSAQVDAFLGALSAPAQNDAALAESWRNILPLYFHRFSPEIGATFLKQIRFSAPASNRSLLGCLPHYNVLGRLGEVTVPTLVLSGRYDFICPVEQGGERLRDAIKGSALVVFEQSGHFPFVEERELYLRTIGAWTGRLSA